jgi:hypothetical protein
MANSDLFKPPAAANSAFTRRQSGVALITVLLITAYSRWTHHTNFVESSFGNRPAPKQF